MQKKSTQKGGKRKRCSAPAKTDFNVARKGRKIGRERERERERKRERKGEREREREITLSLSQPN